MQWSVIESAGKAQSMFNNHGTYVLRVLQTLKGTPRNAQSMLTDHRTHVVSVLQTLEEKHNQCLLTDEHMYRQSYRFSKVLYGNHQTQ